MKYKCESCGGTYETPQADGSEYHHACPPETKNPRNENAPRGMQYFDRKPVLVSRDPQDTARRIATPLESEIISEGEGRTAVELPE